MTPEGRVKKMVSSYLKELQKRLTDRGLDLYWTMHVPTGYGKNNHLDYTFCLAGHFVAIETKAPGEWLTALQRQTCRQMLASGASVFIISSPEGLASFVNWVERNERWIFDARCYGWPEGAIP